MYDDLERVELADELARFIELRGGNDSLVAKVLDGKSPRQRASELISGTTLFDVESRRKLADGGPETILASQDPLIQLARTLEPEYRELRKLSDSLSEQERQAYAVISDAKFKAEGDKVYPDATFTLRLAFGLVKNYQEDGKAIASSTNMAGAFQHELAHGKTGEWVLPDSWHAARANLRSETPLNFVCTADIIGGNSGSPVVDRDGRLVGVIFDGNIQSLTADFYHSEDQGRAVAVHIAGVLESLRSIYSAGDLADQIGN